MSASGNLRQWAQRLPRPAYVVARSCYWVMRRVIRTHYWACRLAAYWLGRRNRRGRLLVGLHTVFIAKENILFLKEWILYHRLKGVTHFFLYDNTGVTRPQHHGKSPYTIAGQVSKYAIPYGEIVNLSDSEVRRILDDIQREIPNVEIVRWQPRDSEGSIMHGQVLAANDALSRFGEIVEWMVFMDMDEYMVSGESVPELCKWMESRGYDGGVMADRPMSARFDNLDRYVVESGFTYCGPYMTAPKYMCDTRRVLHADVHGFESRGYQHMFDTERLFFLHYKMPSRHPEMWRYFQDDGTTPASELLDGVKALAGEHCTPEWRLNAVHPDWRQMMESVYPRWHLDDID